MKLNVVVTYQCIFYLLPSLQLFSAFPKLLPSGGFGLVNLLTPLLTPVDRLTPLLTPVDRLTPLLTPVDCLTPLLTPRWTV